MPAIGGGDVPMIIRCQYCSEIMKAGTEGGRFVCPRCDHVAIPSHPSYLL